MLSKVYTAALSGIDAYAVTVETDLSAGLPALHTVGLPSVTIREASERVRSAILNSRLRFPVKRITVNLSPAGSRKEGSHFDLPLAIGILAAGGEIAAKALCRTGFLGELSLDGRLVAVKGALPLAEGIYRAGIRELILPAANAAEAAMVRGLDVIPLGTLEEAVSYLRGERNIAPYRSGGENMEQKADYDGLDFGDVRGQEEAKRAILIAAAGGGHGIYFTGPPGTGKTMLARRIPTIMPELSYEESMELTKIYSISGLLSAEEPFVRRRPCRMPYHAITSPALLGGGRVPKPGEISLAHCGVLFLDEFPEFDRHVIEMLRQPMETGEISVERADGRVRFPASFLLAAAGNPCKCGYFGDTERQCICSGSELRAYQGKLSGPILDRIDLQIRVEKARFGDISAGEANAADRKTMDSKTMRRAVCAALAIQRERYRNEAQPHLSNAKIEGKILRKYCALDSACHAFLQEAYEKLGLSARGYEKTLRVARTIADLEASEQIRENHVAEALRYRALDYIYAEQGLGH